MVVLHVSVRCTVTFRDSLSDRKCLSVRPSNCRVNTNVGMYHVPCSIRLRKLSNALEKRDNGSVESEGEAFDYDFHANKECESIILERMR